VELQNTIVDARYAQKDWRTGRITFGNRVHYVDWVHFVCPKPEDVVRHDGMEAYGGSCRKGPRGCSMRAALTGFGFVFVHPFEDGTAASSLLIHHSHGELGYTPQGIVFPVSAVSCATLRNMTRR